MTILNMDNQSCKIVAEFFTVLSNYTRMRILCSLKNGRKTVGDLATEMKSSLPNISQHLRIMKDKGAVVSSKEGKQVYYKVENNDYLKGIMLIRDYLVKELKKNAQKVTDLN